MQRAEIISTPSEETCEVGKGFYLVPLIAWLNADAPFFIVAVSQNRVQFFRGTRFELAEIEVPRLPANRSDALKLDVRERILQGHPGQSSATSRGKQRLVLHGQGGAAETDKKELMQYCRKIDEALASPLDGQNEPLIFAGVDYLFPLYREQNHYPYLLDKHIGGNPDLLSRDDLRGFAWPIIEERIKARQNVAIERFGDRLAHGLATHYVDDILSAARNGRIDTLLIAPLLRLPGRFDPQTESVAIDMDFDNSNEDLVNLAAADTLRNGGTVETLDANQIPEHATMAALLRYPARVVQTVRPVNGY